jgi:glycosyltransferase involved in cell wall biosynthesis
MKERFKNILFVCDYYYPNPTSIGVSVGKLVDELKDRGCKVSVLCYSTDKEKQVNEHNGVKIYYINRKIGDKLKSYGEKNIDKFIGKVALKIGMTLIRIGQIIYYPWFRLSSLSVPIRYYIKINKLYRENRYDMICSSHSPFDGTLGSYLFKENNPNVFWVCYILDSLTNKGDTKFISTAQNDKKGWKWEKRFYSKADRIINIRCNFEHNQKERYDVYRDKMFIADVPLMDTRQKKASSRIERTSGKNGKTTIVYAGRLLSHLSSPEYLLKVIKNLPVQLDCCLYFYSNGDCKNLVQSFAKDCEDRIKYTGLVSHEELLSVYDKADILVSIGSKRPDMLPSKIFEYMTMGKKIIHVAKGDGDVCVDHYKKYPQALIIDEREEISESVRKASDFIKEKEVNVDIKELEKCFIENTPSYSADILLK